MKPNPYLVLSSLTLGAPAITSYLMNDYLMMSLYGSLTIISSIYHATKNPHLVYLDYTTAQITHAFTIHRIIPGGSASLPYYSGWLAYVVFIYYYGYVNKVMVWNPDLDAATPWHMSLHFACSLMACYTLYATYLVTKKVKDGL